MNFHALIMAGGGGTRFWPRSRQLRPKQFLRLVGERSLIQQAYDRLESLVPSDRLWVITAAVQAEQVRQHLPALPPGQIIAEPVGRDTAACIALGAALIQSRDPDAVMIVTPADHVIEPPALFHRTIQAAVHLAAEHPQALITLGIPPTYPAVGYGYIECGEPLGSRLGIEAFRLRHFKEKPDFTTAQRYVAAGGYFWNSGIFIWHVSAIIAELERLRPELMAAVRHIADAWTAPERDTVFRTRYEPLVKISIDHAVMEHCAQALVLRAPFTWDDLGSWPALARHRPQDASGNTVLEVQHVGVRTRLCIIVGDSAEQLIATAGLEHLLIVRDGNALLVADSRDEAAIKELVETLKAQGRSVFL